ncbi:hypothetical protein M8C21_010870 [Ambrosia artemisiifolia]|uniref:Cathepsin propeptide inhibitor domain-containing protein n=1 Tax=Ambrosia artemisiifolia TaxID=4212 RepID=A0AAD5C5G1_AMBAR|nr:hypothetical protein M8C21_010870 [Ambrosia artemisiifolia]
MTLVWKKSTLNNILINRRLWSKGSTVVFSAAGSNGWRSEDELKEMFESWATKMGKSYETLEEKEKRFKIFRDALKHVELHNSTGDPSCKLALNKFADQTTDEVRRRLCGGNPLRPVIIGYYLPKRSVSLPPNINQTVSG